jgi:hypothetical protein
MAMMTARVFLKNRSSFIRADDVSGLEKMKASTITAYHHIIIINLTHLHSNHASDGVANVLKRTPLLIHLLSPYCITLLDRLECVAEAESHFSFHQSKETRKLPPTRQYFNSLGARATTEMPFPINEQPRNKHDLVGVRALIKSVHNESTLMAHECQFHGTTELLDSLNRGVNPQDLRLLCPVYSYADAPQEPEPLSRALIMIGVAGASLR